ncbi:uncharacterized protein HD556DRAFT_1450626 [Suillus plorans]|uniref:Uncharacterized protein n=1 Tax=Suillus plorans TaxID=116603 RepID=A0A9P7DBA9_9AGAM|nr:uncharacterized protein HD556DRAFT_1450626 [Suillus plorans]KAG1785491.1 hypothetical protein HD556DRAFT_1450626 [Suillus plorans]
MPIQDVGHRSQVVSVSILVRATAMLIQVVAHFKDKDLGYIAGMMFGASSETVSSYIASCLKLTTAFWCCCRLGELVIDSLTSFDPEKHIARSTPSCLATSVKCSPRGRCESTIKDIQAQIHSTAQLDWTHQREQHQ